jgi:hypothetical protein
MPWSVEIHPDLAPELRLPPRGVRQELGAHVGLIEQFGPALGRPAVDTLKGSSVANLKELRFSAGGGVWRVAFAFDGNRVAVLLAAGDKGGKDQNRFYRAMMKLAEERWTTWKAS